MGDVMEAILACWRELIRRRLHEMEIWLVYADAVRMVEALRTQSA